MPQLKNLIQVGLRLPCLLPFSPQFKIIFAEIINLFDNFWNQLIWKSTLFEFQEFSVAFSCTLIVWQWSTTLQFCCLVLFLQLISWFKITMIFQGSKLKTENMIVCKVFETTNRNTQSINSTNNYLFLQKDLVLRSHVVSQLITKLSLLSMSIRWESLFT